MATVGTSTDVVLERWRGRVAAQQPKPESDSRRVTRRTPDSIERPLTVLQAATELGLSVHTIRAWVAARRLAHIRLGRSIRIPAAEIRRVIEANTIPAVEDR